MSKAFTKDDADAPPLVVPRPPLPEGSPNYVTARGLASLRAELRQLDVERAHLEAQEAAPDRVRTLAILHARIHELGERIASAVPVDPHTQPRDAIRFGAKVTVHGETGKDRHYEIVGVDEADVAHGRVAFSAPLARALLGKRTGDVVTLRTPRGEEELEIVAIAYEVDPS